MAALTRLQAAVACVLALTCLTASEQAAGQHRILVILEDLAAQHTHSNYFHSLQVAGYDLTFKAAEDSSLQLQHWDDYLYTGVIVLGSGIQGAECWYTPCKFAPALLDCLVANRQYFGHSRL